jgi:hypothetical protein
MCDISYKELIVDRFQRTQALITGDRLAHQHIGCENTSCPPNQGLPRLVGMYPWLASEEEMKARWDESKESPDLRIAFVEEMCLVWDYYGVLGVYFGAILSDIINTSELINDTDICWSLIRFLSLIIGDGEGLPADLVDAGFWNNCLTLELRLLSSCDNEKKVFVGSVISKTGLFCPDLIRDLAASENRLYILELMKDCLFEYRELANEAIRILILMAPWRCGELDDTSLNRMIEFAVSGLADPDISPLMFHALSENIDCLRDIDYANIEQALNDAKTELESRSDVESDALMAGWNDLMQKLTTEDSTTKE